MALINMRAMNGALMPHPAQGIAKQATIVGCPLYRNVSDGKLTAVATDCEKLIGFAASPCDADGDAITYIPCRPDVQFLMTFTGTYAITKLGTYVAIDVASQVPTADLDTAGHDILKLEEVVNNDAINGYTAWFSAATTANQTMIEVA